MIGAVVTFVVAAICNILIKKESKVYDLLGGYKISFMRRESLILAGFFILMILFTLTLGSIFS